MTDAVQVSFHPRFLYLFDIAFCLRLQQPPRVALLHDLVTTCVKCLGSCNFRPNNDNTYVLSKIINRGLGCSLGGPLAVSHTARRTGP